MANFDTPELLEALQNIEKGNYSVAFEVLAHMADAGNPKAQCNLANLYQFGWGVTADGVKAAELYCKVARQNIHEKDFRLWPITIYLPSISAAPRVQAPIMNELQNIQP